MSESNPGLMAFFNEVIKLTDPTERLRFLDRVCAGDADLRKRLEAMLNDRHWR